MHVCTGAGQAELGLEARAYQFGMGLSLVHGVGHWLGLLHPANGGCSILAVDDFVPDTPRQAFENTICTASV